MNRLLRSTLVMIVCLPVILSAQQRPPIRQLGAVASKSAETFNGLVAVRPLSSGALLVNDLAGRRVLMFDPTLSRFTVVADTTAATANAYGGPIGTLVAYRGDSTFFVDPTSVSMMMVDPSGKIGKVVAIPRAEDANTIGSPVGNASFDSQGRLVYRANARLTFTGRPPGAGGPAGFSLPEPPDSALIMRVDPATRKVDTIGVIRTPKIKLETKSDDKGNFSITSLINPLPVVDDWTVTSDGAIAFVRGRDYHIDWINPDGSKLSSAKIPFDWQRMTDEDKVAFIDSVKAARARLGANAPAPVIGGLPGGGGGSPQVQIFRGTGAPGGGPPAGGPGQAQLNFVQPGELPDYKPPFFAGGVRADRDGNVWIRTIAAVGGGPVYDVVNRKGELIDRVQIPADRTIAGFGVNGAVYLINRNGTTATLEKATVR